MFGRGRNRNPKGHPVIELYVKADVRNGAIFVIREDVMPSRKAQVTRSGQFRAPLRKFKIADFVSDRNVFPKRDFCAHSQEFMILTNAKSSSSCSNRFPGSSRKGSEPASALQLPARTISALCFPHPTFTGLSDPMEGFHDLLVPPYEARMMENSLLFSFKFAKFL